ncbi:hypothetical protein E3V55_06040 [Candidatus Marinimicrobia bacterium MT.SAG.3]|nr:hypothetical protein E3V55_06040 [Candidatus Marinimicrobia bacterium MT.SAG.3]
MKRITILLLLVMFVVAGCGESSPKPTSSRPDWIDTGADSPTQISAVGVGDTKLDAVASALGELSRIIEAKVANIDSSVKDETSDTTYAVAVSKIDPSISFGKVKVQSNFNGMIKRIIGTDGEEETESYQQTVIVISLGDSLNSFKIKFFKKETETNNKAQLTTYIEASGENLNFASLLNELEAAEVKIKTYETEKEYYVLLIYDIENLKK